MTIAFDASDFDFARAEYINAPSIPTYTQIVEAIAVPIWPFIVDGKSFEANAFSHNPVLNIFTLNANNKATMKTTIGIILANQITVFTNEAFLAPDAQIE